MLRNDAKVSTVSRKISEAANGALEGYAQGEDIHEPEITGLILGAIGERIRNKKIGRVTWNAEIFPNKEKGAEEKHYEFDGVTWNSHILTSRGKGAEEKRYGADLMGVLDIKLPDYKVMKWFFVQAKKAEPNSLFQPIEWDRLMRQCENMLAYTPDSFVFVYSRKKRIRVFPAVSVFGLRSRNIFDLYHHGVQRFFKDHLQCFIGTPWPSPLGIKTPDTLAAFPAFPIERILYLTARMPE